MGIRRVILTGVLFGQTVQNVLHFDDHDSGILIGTFAGDIHVNFLTQWKIFQHTGCTWTDIAVQQVAPVPGLTFHLPINVPGVGNGVTGADLPHVCFLIKLQSMQPGKAGRGRLYSPAPSASFHTFGIVTNQILSDRQAPLAAIMARYGSVDPPSGHSLGVWSRKIGDPIHPVISMNLSSRIATQRRRNYGVGV